MAVIINEFPNSSQPR